MRHRRAELVFVLFFFSGLAGLIYESVWSHYVKLFLGHAAYAQTLVLVVFIGGLALGSWLCARIAERIRNPLRTYAQVEGAIGLLALLFHPLFIAAVDWGYATLLPNACEQSSTFCAAQWMLAAVMLAPQSILLGATFPLVSSAVLRISAGNAGYSIASLYFLNSLGAVLGVLASAFVLIPSVGLPGTLMAAGLANLLIAVLAFLLSRSPVAPLVVEPIVASAADEAWDDRRIVKALLATAMLTGLSSFIYEIVWIRMLSLVLGASTYSFELMLASFILGIALGGLWIRKRVDLSTDTVRLLAFVQIVMGLCAVATLPLYNVAFDFMAWLLSAVSHNDAGFAIFNLASIAICLAIMLPATFCAGMTLPLITYRLLRSREGERALGAVYAINTLGSIAGVIVAVHLLLTHIGTGPTLVAGAAIDVVLGLVLFAGQRGPRGVRIPVAAQACLILFVVLAVVGRIDATRAASGVFRTGVASIPGNTLLFHRDGKTATVDVTGGPGLRTIHTNGKPDAGMSLDAKRVTPDEFTMALLAVLPLGYNPEAQSAAVIGLGSGSSTTTLLGSERLKRVDTVEIEPAIVEGAQLFRPRVDRTFADPRSHIVIDDAKSYFARGRNRYDIIVSEPSNPWVSGVSSLFTEEFYGRVALYLNDGGVLSQWLHVYEMDSGTLASILAAIRKTFPDYVMYIPTDGDIVLVARKNGRIGAFDPKVLGWPGLQPVLTRLHLTEPEALRRHAVASSATIARYFATYGMPANSDFFPLVDHRTSKTRFTKVRAEDLSTLQAAGVPFLEMLDGNVAGTTGFRPILSPTIPNALAVNAWFMYAGARGTAPEWEGNERQRGDLEPGRLVRLWSENCGPQWDFASMLDAMVRVAEVTAPQLEPSLARGIWGPVAASRCGRALPADDKHWIELFDAVAARDAARMASLGEAVLAKVQSPGPAPEYALLAAATGLICKGEAAQARDLMDKNVARAVRRNDKVIEIRYLYGIVTDPAAAQAAARCR